MDWTGLLRKVTDRRRSPRRKIPRLCALSWNGSVPAARVVNEISCEGASIETPDKWYPGTLIYLQLVFSNEPPSLEVAGRGPVHFGVWSRVVRQMPWGMCVEFVFAGQDDRRHFRRFMRAAEQKQEHEPAKV
jgi:hypothetical protein